MARCAEGHAGSGADRGPSAAGRRRKPRRLVAVEGEISEFRIDYGPGYRLYFVRRGRVILVLLNGGNKSTQRRDIRRALKLASELGADL